MDRRSFGRRLNKVRRDRRITGERLAELCNINATYLRQIEAGTKTPSLPVFVTICRELDVSPNYLLIDILPDIIRQDIEPVRELCKKASPNQLEMVAAMIEAALDAISE